MNCIKRNLYAGLSIVLMLISNRVIAGDYANNYGAHPAANALGNAVTATVNDSSAVFYNVAGLGRVSDAEQMYYQMEQAKEPQKEAPPGKEAKEGLEEGEKGKWWQHSLNVVGDTFTKDVFKQTPVKRPKTPITEVAIQYHYVSNGLRTNAPTDRDLKHVNDNYASLGLTMNLNSLYDFGRVVRFGLNIITPATGRLLTVDDQNATVHRYLNYGVSNEKPIIMGGLGFEIWKDHLFAGIGFNALMKGSGAILLKNVPISPDTTIPNQQSILQLKPLVTGTYGLQFTYGKIHAGASYRGEVSMSVSPLYTRAQTTLLGIQLDLRMGLFGLYTPAVSSFGLGYDITDKITVTVDAQKMYWGRYHIPYYKSTYTEPFRLHDTVNYGIGVEYKILNNVAIRGGWQKKPTPLPNMPRQNNWMGFNRASYMLGGSYTLFPSTFSFLKDMKRPVTFDAVVEYQSVKHLTVHKYNPTVTNPDYWAKGSVWNIGLSITMMF